MARSFEFEDGAVGAETPRGRTALALAELAELAGAAEGAPGRVRLHTVSLTRWVAVIGQLFTILFVHFSLGIDLPLLALLPAVALSALVNLALALRAQGDDPAARAQRRRAVRLRHPPALLPRPR